MLVLNKKGIGGALDPKDIMSLMNFRLYYVLFDTPAIKVLSRITGESNGELRRKIKQGGIFIGDSKITDPNEPWNSGNVGCFVFIGKEPVGILMPIRNGII